MWLGQWQALQFLHEDHDIAHVVLGNLGILIGCVCCEHVIC